MLYDNNNNNNNNNNNTYSRMYVALPILDCNYSPWETKRRGSTPHTFDCKLMSASFPNFIT